MEQKAFTLINRGMNRDLSVSKTAESSAYENHNIRILAREGDTMLSVTNERGNKEVPIGELNGTMVGWNVLNNYIILFVKGDDEDFIYRIEYKGNDEMEKVVVFHGNLVLIRPIRLSQLFILRRMIFKRYIGLMVSMFFAL